MAEDEELKAEDVVDAALHAPPPTEISITCDGAGGHPNRTLATFRSVTNRWVMNEPRYERSSPTEGIRHESARASAWAPFEGRAKYEISCKLCISAAGNPFKIQPTAATLYPLLERLAGANITSISLRALAARL